MQEVDLMKPFVKIILIVFVGILIISSLFSLLGAVLGIAFGVFGTVLGFIWRVIFSPALLILLIIWIVSRVVKKR